MDPSPGASGPIHPDVHSHSNPWQIRVRHLELDLDVSFEQQTLTGAATLMLDRIDPAASRLRLDTRGLDIAAAETSRGGATWSPAPFALSAPDPILGSALTIELPRGADRVRIRYATRPGASG